MTKTEQNMRRLMLSLLVLVAQAGWLMAAEEVAPIAHAGIGSPECEAYRVALKAPYFYCDCHERSADITVPFELEVRDTTWFRATVNELKAGLAAYWYSNTNVTIEIFAFCTSKEPALQATVGPDSMYEMSIDEINRRIADMGPAAQQLMDAFTPYIRVYPHNGGSGVVYCYPYNQGPHSSCERLLQVRYPMTYVTSNEHDVYELEPNRIPQSGNLMVRWVQQYNRPCTMKVLRGDCESGELVVETQMSDSDRVYMLDPEMVKQARQASQPLYFRFEHQNSYAGRVRFYPDPYVTDSMVTLTTCQGIGLQMADTLLTESTVYTDQPRYIGGDTVKTITYNLTVTEPEIVYDTLTLKAVDLPQIYRNQEVIADFGDYDFTIHRRGQCDVRYLLTVLEEKKNDNDDDDPDKKDDDDDPNKKDDDDDPNKNDPDEAIDETTADQQIRIVRTRAGVYIIRSNKIYDMVGRCLTDR